MAIKYNCCPQCGMKDYAHGFCHDLQHCHSCGWNYTSYPIPDRKVQQIAGAGVAPPCR